MDIFVIAILFPVVSGILWGYNAAKTEVEWVCLPDTPMWRKVSLSRIAFDSLFLGSILNLAAVPTAMLAIPIFLRIQPKMEIAYGALLGWLVGLVIALTVSFVTAFYWCLVRKKPIGWYHA